jgi:hypothetical protein
MTVPCRLHDARLLGFAGEVCLSRKFGYPGQIDSFERVWLTFAAIDGKASISLNGSTLGTASGPCEFDVTGRLKPHNRLEVLLMAESDESGLTGNVALEVRCAVYLSNLQVHRAEEGAIVAAGELLGAWPEPFDLYFFLDDVEVDYQNLRTNDERTLFRAVLKPLDEAKTPARVRVDLIQGPSLWSSAVVELS